MFSIKVTNLLKGVLQQCQASTRDWWRQVRGHIHTFMHQLFLNQNIYVFSASQGFSRPKWIFIEYIQYLYLQPLR